MFRLCMLLVVLVVGCGPKEAVQQTRTPTETLVAVGGSSTNALLASNLSVGLAMELWQAKAMDQATFLRLMKQVESQMSTNLSQLLAFRAVTPLTDEDDAFFKLIVEGMNGVLGQTIAIREAAEKNENTLLDEYNKHRADTEAVIRKISGS